MDKLKKLEAILNGLKSDDLLKYVGDLKDYKTAVDHLNKAIESLKLRGKKAKVNEGSKWIYQGHTFAILEIYALREDSMELRLDLTGTKFEFKENKRNPLKPYHQKTTVINTKYLTIIDQ